MLNLASAAPSKAAVSEPSRPMNKSEETASGEIGDKPETFEAALKSENPRNEGKEVPFEVIEDEHLLAEIEIIELDVQTKEPAEEAVELLTDVKIVVEPKDEAEVSDQPVVLQQWSMTKAAETQKSDPASVVTKASMGVAIVAEQPRQKLDSIAKPEITNIGQRAETKPSENVILTDVVETTEAPENVIALKPDATAAETKSAQVRSQPQELTGTTQLQQAAADKPAETMAKIVPQMPETVRSITDAIRENSGSDTKQVSTPTAVQTVQTKPDGTVLKILRIQLHPIELGKVDLNLRMVGGQMQVDVRAETQLAYQQLSVDAESLADSIRAMGYRVDNLSIQGPGQANTGMTADQQGSSDIQQRAAEDLDRERTSGGDARDEEMSSSSDLAAEQPDGVVADVI